MTEEGKAATSGTNENPNQGEEEKVSPIKLKITMDKRIDLAVSMFIILLGVFVLITASGIDEGRIPDPLTSQGLPNLAGISLIIVGIILTVMRLASWSALPGHLVPSEGKGDEEAYPASWKQAFSIVAAAWLSVWLLRSLGYLISMPLFLIAALLIFGVRSWAQRIGFAIVFTAATWIAFGKILGFRVPLGFLEPLARRLGLIL